MLVRVKYAGKTCKLREPLKALNTDCMKKFIQHTSAKADKNSDENSDE